MIKKWSDFNIEVPKGKDGQVKVLCPLCSHKRTKNPDEACLSADLDIGRFLCHNCGYKGYLDTEIYIEKEKFKWSEQVFIKPSYQSNKWTLDKKTINFFKARGISEETLLANLVGSGQVTYDGGKTYQNSASCPFIKNDELVNVQYRSIEEKRFMMIKGAEKPFYGLQHIIEDNNIQTEKIIIVEGLFDKLALYEAGFRFAISVPNGSPFEQEGDKPKNPKLLFLDDPDFINIITKVKEIVFATDSDYQGTRLRNAIAERIGIEKCKFVVYPKNCKDINEVLIKYGVDKVVEIIQKAENFPINGLLEIKDIKDDLISFYNMGFAAGLDSGIEELDEIFTLSNPSVITVTGAPESLKTVLVDNLVMKYAMLHNIKTAIFSPESKPETFHIARLASMHNGYNFGHPDMPNRMPVEDFKKSYEWISDRFVFLNPENNTLDEILSLAKSAILIKGIKVLVIDPFSKISFEGESLHNSVRDMFSKLNKFVHTNKVTIFLIAHPKKLEFMAEKKDVPPKEIKEYRVTQPYDIAESSHFYNSSDYILSCWKSRLISDAPLKVFVQKSKLHHIAKSGKKCELEYNYQNWRLGWELN